MITEQSRRAMDNREPTEKLRVAILFGGRSGEHEVSLRSAASVIETLDRDKYDVRPVFLDQQENWFADVLPEFGRAVGNDLTVAAASSRRGNEQSAAGRDRDARGRIAEPFRWLAEEADVVFPVLHGTYGEDGTMQGLLEIVNVPYVGAGVVASAVAMDKAIFKHVMASHGFPVLPWQLVTGAEFDNRVNDVVERIESTLAYPVFTKPANLGSSVGISRCNDRRELVAGLRDAARYDRRMVVEQGIRPRELEVAVLGNDSPAASVVGEIRPTRGFYDYTAKYVSGDSELLIPAPLDERQTAQAQELALAVYRAIDGAGMARVDLFLEATSGRLYVNEINTIPGFTEVSMFPKLWAASGVGYCELLDRLIGLALERFRGRQRLQRSYGSA